MRDLDAGERTGGAGEGARSSWSLLRGLTAGAEVERAGEMIGLARLARRRAEEALQEVFALLFPLFSSTVSLSREIPWAVGQPLD